MSEPRRRDHRGTPKARRACASTAGSARISRTSTHGYLQKLLRTGQVRVDSKRVEANERLEAGAKVRVPKVVRSRRASAEARGRSAARRPTAISSSA